MGPWAARGPQAAGAGGRRVGALQVDARGVWGGFTEGGDYLLVAGEEDHLARDGQLGQGAGGPTATLGVEVHQDVVGQNGDGAAHVVGCQQVSARSVTRNTPSDESDTLVQRPSVITASRRLAWRYTSGWLLDSQVAMAA